MRLSALPFWYTKNTRHRTLRGAYWRSVRAYPETPQSIGEHIRKRRLDLGLEQKEVARRLGVHFETLKNWERGVLKPTVTVMPRVIEFIGIETLAVPTTFAELLVHFRNVRGFRQGDLAQFLKINPTTVGRWETGFEPPDPRRREIEALIRKGAGV